MRSLKVFILSSVVSVLLAACGGGTTANSSSENGGAGSVTVRCAANALCPPAQVNAVNPKSN